ncbi:MAG: antibiotic biosynthesis monooxygenase family protein [Nitrososphaerales archaeon]
MFVAVYEFKVKPGKEAEFQKAWANVTDAMAKHRGALGSRLHQAEQQSVYVAYAQWPSKEKYFDEFGAKKFSAEENLERNILKAATEYIKTVYLMEVVEDKTRR